MNYKIIIPPKILSPFVQYFWILESNDAYTHRSLADGGVELIFHYHGIFQKLEGGASYRCNLAIIQGVSSTYQEFHCDSAFGIFGVYFYPYVIPVLFRQSSEGLRDNITDLFSFMGKEGLFLEEQMIEAKNNAQRVNIVTSFLISKVFNNPTNQRIQEVVQWLIHHKGRINMNELAGKCCLSRRQFERKFVENTGFSPGKYYQITRFQQAAEAYKQTEVNLADLALECGYYDQAHFTNEFVRFSGYRPKDYFTGKIRGVEWRDG